MAAQVQVLESTSQPPGWNLVPGEFVRLFGPVVPEGLRRYTKRYSGAIPADVKVLDVDPQREAAELAALTAPREEPPPIRLATFMKFFGLTHPEQATEMLARLNGLKGRLITLEEFDKSGGLLRIVKVQEWTQKEIQDYRDVLDRVFPGAMPKR